MEKDFISIIRMQVENVAAAKALQFKINNKTKIEKALSVMKGSFLFLLMLWCLEQERAALVS